MSRAKTVGRAGTQARKPTPTRTTLEKDSFFTGEKRHIVPCLLLAAATIALYFPALGNGFVWDDTDYVTTNSAVRDGLAWKTVTWAFTSTHAANWHPLTWLSHALDCQLFALRPMGHHLDSVLIHALNAVVLYLVLVWLTKRTGPSLLVAALFAVHPLNVESVAWVAELKNVLSTLFFLLAIAAYGRYARKPDWRRYLLVGALFAAGLMAKPMVITLPFVLLLLDYWPLGRAGNGLRAANGEERATWLRLALEKVPLLALSAASAVITIEAQRGGGAMHTFAAPVRVENAIVSYALYLWKMVWPARLAALYPYPTNSLPVWQVVLSALFLAGVTILVVMFRRKGYLPVGWFWFLGTLVPVIGLVQVGGAAMADRYAYVPLIGIFIMVAWGLDDWAEVRKVPTVWRAIPVLCVLAALSFVTVQLIPTWKSAYSLWGHTVRVTEANADAYKSLADALMNPSVDMTADEREGFQTEQERMDAARQDYGAALGIYREVAQRTGMQLGLPGMVVTLLDLGNLAQIQNRLDEARGYCEEALKIERQISELPEMALTLTNLALMDKEQNRLDEARTYYEEALQTYRQVEPQDPSKYQPMMVNALMSLGLVERSRKQPDVIQGKAHSHFEEALEIERQLAQRGGNNSMRDMASILLALGNLETEQNRLDEARQHFEGAVKIYRQMEEQSPGRYLADLAGTLTNLGVVARLDKQPEDSHAYYSEALNIYRGLAQRDPRYASSVAAVEAAMGGLGNNSGQR